MSTRSETKRHCPATTSSALRFSPCIISFLSKGLWLYDITEQGLIVRHSLRDTRGTGAVTAELGAGAGWRRPS